MCYAYRRVGRIDALTTGAACAHHVDAQFLVLDIDVDFFRLGHHRDRHGRGMDAALGFGCRNALYAVYALLVLETTEYVGSRDRRDDFLEAATIGL
jgi:hypothetical protein